MEEDSQEKERSNSDEFVSERMAVHLRDNILQNDVDKDKIPG